MKSRAHFMSHPIHPILVAFPIAFLTGGLAFDILAYLLEKEAFATTSFHLIIAGIGSGLLAAIPGLIDLDSTVPPNSSAKKRGILHGTLNGTALLLFGAALWLRQAGTDPLYILLTELSGFVLMTVAGFMGGTLVYRNQIGVDIRYAQAGKWKEVYAKVDDGRIRVSDASDLKEDQMRLILAGDRRIVLARTSGGFVAFDDRCTHRGGSLAGGSLVCGRVQCPWHGSQFDVQSGAVMAGPAARPVRSYSVVLSGQDAVIEL